MQPNPPSKDMRQRMDVLRVEVVEAFLAEDAVRYEQACKEIRSLLKKSNPIMRVCVICNNLFSCENDKHIYCSAKCRKRKMKG